MVARAIGEKNLLRMGGERRERDSVQTSCSVRGKGQTHHEGRVVLTL